MHMQPEMDSSDSSSAGEDASLGCSAAVKARQLPARQQRHYGSQLLLAQAPVTVGIVEMGGASLQVTYQAAHAVPTAFAMPVALPRRHKCALFTHSFNGWGREAAMKRIITDETSPCYNKGYRAPDGVPFHVQHVRDFLNTQHFMRVFRIDESNQSRHSLPTTPFVHVCGQACS